MGYEAGTEIPFLVLSHLARLPSACFSKIHSYGQHLKPSPHNGVIISGRFSGHMINIYCTSNATGAKGLSRTIWGATIEEMIYDPAPTAHKDFVCMQVRYQ